MGSNGMPKKRGGAYYLHKQWIATTKGREEHARNVEKEKEKRKDKRHAVS